MNVFNRRMEVEQKLKVNAVRQSEIIMKALIGNHALTAEACPCIV